MRKALWAGAVLGSLCLGLELACGLLWLLRGTPAPLPKGPLPAGPKYTVAVLGDVQKGLANFANLLGIVAKEQAGMILQTGDLVAENDPGHYRLVKLAYARSGLQVPFFVTPGNHDLKARPELFEQEIGPLEQSFVVGDVAFVLVQNAWGAPPPDAKHLDERIAAAGPHRAVVLALHQPPFDLQGAPKPDYGPFLQWLEKSGVAYVVSGHVHAYLRKTVGSTVVIVNGVGGDYDSWQLDQKVYATILEVDGSRITDRVVELPPEHGLMENLDHLALGHFSEGFRRKPLLGWGGSLLLAGGVAWAFRRLFANREPFRAPAG
ncbi:MAG: metallophosphoesterase [Planctomycetaceae bacterium]|nr:metallophosphoesterase [Planctomycetaceae bacterium]